MSARDRIVLMVIVVAVALGAAWTMVVSPERKKASSLDGQVATARQALATAEDELTKARAAQKEYPTAYASVVSLGKAVPPSSEVPSLIYELESASNNRGVEFASITATAGSGSSGSASPATAGGSAASTAASAVASAGFSQMPFTFVFNGSFFDLEHLFSTLDGFAHRDVSGNLVVNGRLMTIQSARLSPNTAPGGTPVGSGATASQLTGTISATAYVLPASQATPAGPAGGPASSPTPASASGGGSSPTPPAVVTR